MAGKIGYKLVVFMSKQMIACDEASFLISYRHENQLGFKRWWQLSMHLLSCHLCRKYARQIDQLNASVDQYRERCNHESRTHYLAEESSARIQHTVDAELNVK